MELAAHASGLPRDPGNLPKTGRRYSRKDMRTYLSSHKSLPAPPDARHAYSNPGYGILALGHGSDGGKAPDCLKSWPALDGAGAMYSSLDDTLSWLRFNLGLTDSPMNNLPHALRKPRIRTEFGAAGFGWRMRRLVSFPEESMILKMTA